jgi:hypothetical protein
MRRIAEAEARGFLVTTVHVQRPGRCTYGDRDFRQCPLLRGGKGVAVEPWTDDEGNRWDDLGTAEIGVIIVDFALPPVSLGGHVMGVYTVGSLQ